MILGCTAISNVLHTCLAHAWHTPGTCRYLNLGSVITVVLTVIAVTAVPAFEANWD